MKIKKPVLLDSLVFNKGDLYSETKINGKWYIAKPISYPSLVKRFYHSYLVLTGKAFAVQHAEDYFKE